MKKCSTCDKLKPLTEYHLQNKATGRPQSSCKECTRGLKWKWLKSKQTLYTIVYYIPAHNYVGITNNVVRRKHEHVARGMNINGWIEIGRYYNRADAESIEFKLHRLGYNG